MQAELRKLMVLPTARWTLITVSGFWLLTLILIVATGPGESTDAAHVGIGFPSFIGAIVLGAWMAGLEYGQGTVRRALTADPRRVRFMMSKMVVAVGAVVVVTFVLFALASVLFSAAAGSDAAPGVLESDEIFEAGLGWIINNAVFAAVSLALAMLTRSMAGGMTMAFVFAFVLNIAFAAIPDVGDYALGVKTGELIDAITGEDDDVDVAGAVITIFVWLGVIIGAATARFVRTDVK